MNPHYFSEHQTGTYKASMIKTELKGHSFIFEVASGMFSPKRIDPGTLLLIKKAMLPVEGSVLDVGSGYGAIGLALAKANPHLRFTLVEINRRAIKCALANAKNNNVRNAEVRWGDLYSGLGHFDAILTNPPQTAGKKVCFRLIDGAWEHLNVGGMFELVARHKKGGKDLKRHMEEVFGSAVDLAKGSGYRIYMSIRQR